MSLNPSKFLPVIFDAGAIIKSFELQLWDRLVDSYTVIVLKEVIEEAIYYEDEQAKNQIIDLKPYVDGGKIQAVEVTLEEVQSFFKNFDRTYADRMDPGELASLTYLNKKESSYLIVSGDEIVFKTLGRLGKKEQGISLGKLLVNIGLNKKLPIQYTEEFRKTCTQKGTIDRITGFGKSS